MKKQTLLHIAIQENYIDTIEFIMEHYSDDIDLDASCMYSIELSNSKALAIFINVGWIAGQHALDTASSKGSIELLRQVLDTNSDLDYKSTLILENALKTRNNDFITYILYLRNDNAYEDIISSLVYEDIISSLVQVAYNFEDNEALELLSTYGFRASVGTDNILLDAVQHRDLTTLKNLLHLGVTHNLDTALLKAIELNKDAEVLFLATKHPLNKEQLEILLSEESP